jgi:Rrf2 family protein
MTLLSRKADYSLLILSHLYHTAGGESARTISAQFGLSKPFTANILKELCREGVVTSQRGVKGGYTLVPGAATMSLAELLRRIGEQFELTVCSTDRQAADGCSLASVCPVKTPLGEVHQRVHEVFRSVTLIELFQSNLKPALATLSVLSLPKAREAGSHTTPRIASVDHPCV